MNSVTQSPPMLHSYHDDGTWLVGAHQKEAWEAAHRLEATIFAESNYTNGEETIESAYGDYECQSEFIIELRANAVVGCLRAIRPGENGIKTLVDMEAGKLNTSDMGREVLGRIDILRNVVEVGTISVHPEYQAAYPSPNNVSSHLYSAIIRYTKDHAPQYTSAYEDGQSLMLASFDRRFLAVFKRLFPNSVTDLGTAKYYMGSPTIPVLVSCDAMMEVDKTKKEPLLGDAGRITYI